MTCVPAIRLNDGRSIDIDAEDVKALDELDSADGRIGPNPLTATSR